MIRSWCVSLRCRLRLSRVRRRALKMAGLVVAKWLSVDERAEAPALYQTLQSLVAQLRTDPRSGHAEQAGTGDAIAHGWRPDYVRSASAARSFSHHRKPAKTCDLGGGQLGSTRLISTT